MKKNNKISSKKIFRYSFWALILIFLLFTALTISFLNEHIYQAINMDSESLLSQRKTAQENLDAQGLDEALAAIKNKSRQRQIYEINDIFD